MKKALTIALSMFLMIFYFGIIMYMFFAVLHINILANFECALIFEIIGFLLLIYFVLNNILVKGLKTGFFVPLIFITVIYTIILNVINIVCIAIMPRLFFLLTNFLLLFIYCLISFPIYIMGKR